MTSAALRRVEAGDLCSGCGICKAIVSEGEIDLQYSRSGFLRPVEIAPISAADDRQIERVCPGLVLNQEKPSSGDSYLWGPIERVRVGHAADEAIRFTSSSGGVLSAILQYLIEQGKIDSVIHTSASKAVPVRNVTVMSKDKAGIVAGAGSRYGPSAPLSALNSYLNCLGKMAFVGKPCDVAALRAYARENEMVRKKIPYFISFLCAGVPSENATLEILSELGLDPSEVESFRYRGNGWPGCATAKTHDGDSRSMSYTQSWGNILTHQLQFRCKICPDGSGGFADLVCGDAWYENEDGVPDLDEHEGRSLIISRTPIGEAVVRGAIEYGFVVADDIAAEEIGKMQPYQARRKRLTLSRLLAMRLLGQTTPRYRNMMLLRAALRAGLWPNIKSFLGMARRIVLRKT